MTEAVSLEFGQRPWFTPTRWQILLGQGVLMVPSMELMVFLVHSFQCVAS